jgi:hypothetical protein
VTIYREDREVAHAFTSEDGKYVMSVAKGKPITVRFDTHFSLNNAKDWHPSGVWKCGPVPMDSSQMGKAVGSGSFPSGGAPGSGWRAAARNTLALS